MKIEHVNIDIKRNILQSNVVESIVNCELCIEYLASYYLQATVAYTDVYRKHCPALYSYKWQQWPHYDSALKEHEVLGLHNQPPKTES